MQNKTYHVVNNRYTSIAQIGELICKAKPGIKLLEPLEFLNYLGEEYKKGKGIEYIENILFQYTSEENEAFTQFTVATDRTSLLLNRMGFEWIELTEEHVSKMIEHCNEVGFL